MKSQALAAEAAAAGAAAGAAGSTWKSAAGRQQLHQRPLLLPADDVMLCTDSLCHLFAGCQQPYLAVELSHPALVDLLQISTEPSIDLVFDLLLKISHQHQQQRELQQPLQPLWRRKQHVSSCSVMDRLYQYINLYWQHLEQARQAAEAAGAAQIGQGIMAGSGPGSATACLYRQLQQEVLTMFQTYPLVWLPDDVLTAERAGQAVLDSSTGSSRQAEIIDSSVAAPALQAGRFYCLSELCLTDPSQVLELVACKSLAAAVAVADVAGDAPMDIDGEEVVVLPRPLIQHYPGQQLFNSILRVEAVAAGRSASVAGEGGGEQQDLVLEQPCLQHFLSAISWLAQDAAAAGGGNSSSSVQQVPPLDHWAQVRTADGVMLNSGCVHLGSCHA